MSEIIKRENGRLIIDGTDVTDCTKLECAESLNPICGDFGPTSGVTCHGNPNCMLKMCRKTNELCDNIISKLEELNNLFNK